MRLPSSTSRSLLIATSALGLLAGLLAAGAVPSTPAQATQASAEAASTAASRAPRPQPAPDWPANDPNLFLQVHAGPESPVAGALVQIRNASGELVGSGRTGSSGYLKVKVPRGATPERPYRVRTIGGRIHGRAFDGNLVAIITRVGITAAPRYVDLATTVAARFEATHGAGRADAKRALFRALDLDPKFGHDEMRLASYRVDPDAVRRAARRHGGFDNLVAHIVQQLHTKSPLPDVTTDTLRTHNTYHPQRSARVARSSTDPNAPLSCSGEVLPAPSGATEAATGVYGAQMAAGLISAFYTKDPSLLLSGVAGMVFSNTAGMTNASMLATIQNELGCIEQALSELSKAVDNLKLEVSVESVKPCRDLIKTAWSEYAAAVNSAAAHPNDAAHALNPTTNHSFFLTLGDIFNMNQTCANGINSMLFDSQGGTTAAWPTLVANYKKGDYGTTDNVAFTPTTINNMAMFLQYWGSLMYQQSVMMNDWYNADLMFYGNDDSDIQNTYWGNDGTSTTSCISAPSVTNVDQEATNWCQWQQNIINVWPGLTYSDEVGSWKLNPTTKSSFDVSGTAISAVPGGWGNSTTAWNNDPRGLTPSALGKSDLPNGTWKVSNALASYNNQPMAPLPTPYQRYDRKSVNKTFAPKKDQLDGFINLKDFFFSQLSSTVNSDGTVSPCTTDCPEWLLLAADGKTQMSNDDWNIVYPSCYDDYIANGSLYVYNTRYVHNAIYSPKPWSKNSSGGSIGGETSSKNNNGSKVCAKITPMAWLIARPWTQGGTWPAIPAITSPATVSRSAQLTASNCPTGSCTWSIVSDNTPAGLTLSPTGKLSWSGPNTGTVSILVVAGNGSAFSPQKAITVNLSQP